MCLQARGLLLVNKPPLMYKHERLPSLSVCKIVSHSLELLKHSLSVWSLQYVERSSRWSRITLWLPALCHTLPCRGRSGAVTKHSPYNHQRCTTDILKLSYYQAIWIHSYTVPAPAFHTANAQLFPYPGTVTTVINLTDSKTKNKRDMLLCQTTYLHPMVAFPRICHQQHNLPFGWLLILILCIFLIRIALQPFVLMPVFFQPLNHLAAAVESLCLAGNRCS